MKNYLGFEVDGNSHKQHLTARYLGDQILDRDDFKSAFEMFHKLRIRVLFHRSLMFGLNSDIPVAIVSSPILGAALYEVEVVCRKLGLTSDSNFSLQPHITLKGEMPKQFYTLSRFYLSQNGERIYA